MIRAAAIGMLVLASARIAGADHVWIGEPSPPDAKLVQPAGYASLTSQLLMERHNFEDLPTGASVSQMGLGRLLMTVSPVSAYLAVQSGTVAGAQPSSGTKAVDVMQLPDQPTALTFVTSEPLISVGFVLMGLESNVQLTIYAGEGGSTVLGPYTITGYGDPRIRRWIGISADDRIIRRVQIRPTASDEYAVDDVEFGVHAPEPATAVGFALIVLLRSKRRC